MQGVALGSPNLEKISLADRTEARPGDDDPAAWGGGGHGLAQGNEVGEGGQGFPRGLGGAVEAAPDRVAAPSGVEIAFVNDQKAAVRPRQRERRRHLGRGLLAADGKGRGRLGAARRQKAGADGAVFGPGQKDPVAQDGGGAGIPLGKTGAEEVGGQGPESIGLQPAGPALAGTALFAVAPFAAALPPEQQAGAAGGDEPQLVRPAAGADLSQHALGRLGGRFGKKTRPAQDAAQEKGGEGAAQARKAESAHPAYFSAKSFSRLLPASSHSMTHFGLRPRPDQVSAALAGLR